MATRPETVSNLAKDALVGLVLNIVASLVVTIKSIWLGLTVFIVCLVLGLGYLLFKKYKRLAKLIWSGAYGYYFSFPVSENPMVWTNAKTSLKYLGISGHTIFPAFRDWLGSLPANTDLKIDILLMAPDAKALEKQLLFERNTSDPALIQEELRAIRDRIRAYIGEWKALSFYRDGKLRIRIYDEFVPWWMYVVDDNLMYLGFLPQGKSGLDSPLLMMKRVKEYTTPFNSFYETWRRMWEEATPV